MSWGSVWGGWGTFYFVLLGEIFCSVDVLFNSENYHFVNRLCAYQKYYNIPELFTFSSRSENIEARRGALSSSLDKSVNNFVMFINTSGMHTK